MYVLLVLSLCSFVKKSHNILSPQMSDAHSISTSIAQQKGYRLILSGTEEPLHECNEDVLFTSSNLFILADGHGSHFASTWFVEHAKNAFESLIDSHAWDFSDSGEISLFKNEALNIYATLDSQYMDIKKQEFNDWKTKGADKPIDDGCTLVVNILLDGYFINCNVGDSRTVVGAKLNGGFAEPNESKSESTKMNDRRGLCRGMAKAVGV